MFILETYKDQNFFQIPIIDYINMVAYAKGEIDNILRAVYK